MRRCVCAFSRCCCLACSLSLSLPLTSVFPCIRFCLKFLSSIACSPLPWSLSSSASSYLRQCPSGFSQRHVPSVPFPLGSSLLRWLSPPPLACRRWSSVVIK
ncbi:hypothetical protein GQ42DRAFT_164173 [Ramicandelaber brevisporus]|nr:hypothetical protein GQ42DRAFT_164173 [Ramicandelaber brevisporus]